MLGLAAQPARRAAAAVTAALVASACIGSSAPGTERPPGPAQPASDATPTSPAVGELLLPLPTLPAEGIRFRLTLEYGGRVEVSPHGASGDAQTAGNSERLELVYVQRPLEDPAPGEVASLLILEALRHEVRAAPAALRSKLEIADDRMRLQEGDEVTLDLRGAQPRQRVTPRMILDKPVALLRQDRLGQPLAVLGRGPPGVRSLLRAVPIREAIRYVQVARPPLPVTPGADWTAERRPASPAGALGLAFPVEHRLLGYETIDGVPSAHLQLSGQVEAEHYPAKTGFVFERARVRYEGEAFVDLRNYQLYRLRMEDLVAVSYRRGSGDAATTTRSRYETRATLDRLETPPAPGVWADGEPHFSAP